jgi:apolipoprotein N-acyltransferase
MFKKSLPTSVIKKSLLSLLSAFLLFFSWPPIGFPLLSLIALVPLFYLFANLETKKEIYFYSFLSFLVWNISTTFWIMHASMLGMVLAVLVNTLLMSFVFLLAFIVKSKFDLKRGWWAMLCFWLCFEYIHLNWELSWPWLTLGNGFSSFPSLIQWYEYTGVLGGSLWILISNLFIVQAIDSKKYRYSSLFVVLVPIIISFSVSDNIAKSHIQKFVVVQPNIDPYFEKFNGLSSDQQLDKFIDLALSQIDGTTNYLIGPETAITENLWESNIEKSSSIIKLNNLINQYPNLQILLGATTFKRYKTKATSTARAFTNVDLYYDMFNSALFINKTGVEIYHKSKLVQGVEFMPFESVLGHLDFLSIDLGGISGSLGTQEYRSVFSKDSTRIAPIVCYESIYGEYVSEFVRNGANVLTIITNDGWWKDTPGYLQHLDYARLRAIETRKSIVRSANTGISAFIDPLGNIIDQTDWDQEAVISSEIAVVNENTFYVKYGDYIGRLASFLSVFFICFLIANKKKK